MNGAENFSVSSLVIFGGVASTILANAEIKRDFNYKNPFNLIAFSYLIGTISILLYGRWGEDIKFCASTPDMESCLTSLDVGCLFILVGTLLLLYVFFYNIINNYRESI